MRDLEKAIKEYRTKYGLHKNGKGAFYSSDLEQIYELSKSGDFSTWLFNAIGDALEAGYMVGYRTARRECRDKQRG